MNSRGFTLTEALLALVIIGFLSGLIILPSAVFTNKTNWNQTMLTVRDTIQRARNLARTHGQCVTLFIAPTTMTVTGYTMTPPLASPNPCIALPAASSVYSPTFQPGVTLVPFDLENPLVFLPSGGTDLLNATAKMQVLQSGNSRSYSVNPVLGQIVESVP